MNESKRLTLLYVNNSEDRNLPLVHTSLSSSIILGEEKASLFLTEEFITLRGNSGLNSSSLACQLSTSADVFHQYIQIEAPNKQKSSFKSTYIQQSSLSAYKHNEIRLGSGKTRHDIFVNQLGPETLTTLKHFLISEKPLPQELLSKIRLDYP